MDREVVIAGGGVAACVLARQLAADGRRVTVIGHPRPPSWEGLSPRALEGLARVGCTHAVALCRQPSPRRGVWNDRPAAANWEFLFYRPDLDAALAEDARAAGAHVIRGRVAACLRHGDGWRVELTDGAVITAGFLVEARGRAALAHAPLAFAGPPTVALIRQYSLGAPREGASGVGAFADGWAWFAVFGGTHLVVQAVVDAGSDGDATFAQAAMDIPALADLLRGAVPVARPLARDATPRLAAELTDEAFLRVADAAYAPDPLSGQGIHEAVGGAMAAYRAVTTVLTHGAEPEIAARFVGERVIERFGRLAAVGRDFYRAETRWPDRAFWHRRAGLDLRAIPVLPREAEAVAVQLRPVAAARGIENRRVVVCPAHPRGVWSVADIPVADLLEAVRAPGGLDHSALCTRFAAGRRQIDMALDWLRHHGALPAVAPAI